MAGESPDKSVDEGASGEQDPRLSVFQPRDPLKEAVAAWVATAEPAAAAGPDGDAGTETEAIEAVAAPSRPSPGRVDPPPAAGVVRQAAPAREAGSASTDEADPRAAKPGSASADAAKADSAKPGDAKPAADTERTAVFRAVKPGSASADADPRPAKPGSASADAAKADSAKPDDVKPAADTERTAVFRAVKPGSAPADAEKPSGKSSGDVRTTAFGVVTSEPDPAPDGEKPSQDPRAPKPGSASAKPDDAKPAADTERTAVFRAAKPGSAPADAKKPDSPSADADKPSQDPRAAKPADDSERTAVFRAVKPGSGPNDAKKADSGSADAAKADSVKSDDAKPAADTERTAVFRAVKPGSAPADAKKPDSASADGAKADSAKPGDDSERTAVFRAVKPGSAPADAKKPASPPAGDPRAAKPAADGDRRVSAFVPLRGEEGSAPAAKPAAKPTPPPPAAPRLDPSERTTQQPLPPRPPLDMLADLTNNPPPPPSPVRTAIRRFKIYAPIVLLLAIVIAVVQLVRPLPAPKLQMTAKATYTFAGGNPNLPWPTEGQASMAAAGLGTIGTSGEQKPVPIASVTKSMTAYIIMRDHPFKKGEKGAMIDVDKTAETEGQKDKSDNESTLNTVKEGDKISEYDAIAALMIPSANNIARLLARWDSGSQEAFVKKMNDTAKQLGMTNTTYTDPSGLDATTVSTAEDQVKLGLKIVEIPALVDITRMPSWTDPSGKAWPNWNRLVPFNDSLGIKTGTTTKAGGNLLFAAQKKVGDTNQLIVGAVLGQHKPPIIDSVIAASKSLLIATQKELQGAPVVKKGQVVGYVDDGLGGHTPVVATADVQAVGWSSLTVDIKLGDGGTKIPESAQAGTEVGVLTVGDGVSQVKVPVALQRALETPGFGSKLTRIG
ncbi:D-alanyl-D-alanine carboxypeptidase [Streptomyces sp. NBC_00091]|uniref:D-alanyl-D-alanine carboxypeptidase n=1 Tax=Streptomyces sp. NBC_00091 TaxID=2975648 RepID=UPI002258348F|nr:hypothetical protein [Streptomyces sp. NBC_00091]MCX5377820.1 hypothetical protein [Streptomyces sp. NBC_00091]